MESVAAVAQLTPLNGHVSVRAFHICTVGLLPLESGLDAWTADRFRMD